MARVHTGHEPIRLKEDEVATLFLTPDEALVIADALACVGGRPGTTRRIIGAHILSVLSASGVAEWDRHDGMPVPDINGAVMFHTNWSKAEDYAEFREGEIDGGLPFK